ncbi:hypothetical protein Tco_0672160 [Tanacetum coccineum]
MDSVVCISYDTTPIESDEHLETNHDKKSELSEMSNFILIINDFEKRLAGIFSRRIHRVQVLDFEGLTEEMGMSMDARLSMKHTDEDDGTFSFQLGGARRQISWRQFIMALGLHTIMDPLRRLYHRLIAHTIDGRGHAHEKVARTNLYFMRSVDREAVNLSYLLTHYLFRHYEGRKHEAQMFGGHFIGRLANHFGLIRRRLGPAPEREQVAERTVRLEEEVHEFWQSIVGLHGVIGISITNQSWFATWMISCMTQLMDASGRTYQDFDSTLVGSSHMPYQRRARQRIGEAITSAAPHTAY